MDSITVTDEVSHPDFLFVTKFETVVNPGYVFDGPIIVGVRANSVFIKGKIPGVCVLTAHSKVDLSVSGPHAQWVEETMYPLWKVAYPCVKADGWWYYIFLPYDDTFKSPNRVPQEMYGKVLSFSAKLRGQPPDMYEVGDMVEGFEIRSHSFRVREQAICPEGMPNVSRENLDSWRWIRNRLGAGHDGLKWSPYRAMDGMNLP